MKIILASASPRRQELLKLITENFIIEPANTDETVPENISPLFAAEYTARNKANAVSALHPDDLVIGCDTVVVCEDKILGKPADKSAAFNMLNMLSGRTHKVITGVCICCNKKIISFSEETEVEFYKHSNEEILLYIETGDPFDKAGAYGIQSSLMVKCIKGDYFNVVGLPAARLKRELKKINAI